MENVEITRDGVSRKIPKSTWLAMVKEKSTYGWEQTTVIPEDVAAKEAQIVIDAKASTEQVILDDVAAKEVKVKRSKVKTDEA